MHTMSELALSELVTEHQRVRLEQARQARYAHTLAQMRRVQRKERRAQRQLLRAWRRTDELRASLEAH